MAWYNLLMYRRGFTLIELLVVIAIVAVLAVVVVLVLNPAQLLQQARDSNRLSDLATINAALGYLKTDQPSASLGTASTSYISVLDATATSTAGNQCQGLGMPSLGSSTWQCASSSTYRKSDGTGWIPAALTNVSYGTPLAQLPVDPINATSSNLFYGYSTDGTNYEVTAIVESSKYKTQFALNPQMPGYPEIVALGSSLTLSPLWSSSGLVGWWPIGEGSGSTTLDMSGSGNVGTWNGSTTNGSYYAMGKVGMYAGNFDGVGDYVNVPTNAVMNSTVGTWSLWVNTSAATGILPAFLSRADGNSNNGISIFLQSGKPTVWVVNNSASIVLSKNGAAAINNGAWHNVVFAFNGVSPAYLYVDGAQVASGTPSGAWNFNNQAFRIAKAVDASFTFLPGQINDVRIYNRALSAAEVAALYNAER